MIYFDKVWPTPNSKILKIQHNSTTLLMILSIGSGFLIWPKVPGRPNTRLDANKSSYFRLGPRHIADIALELSSRRSLSSHFLFDEAKKPKPPFFATNKQTNKTKKHKKKNGKCLQIHLFQSMGSYLSAKVASQCVCRMCSPSGSSNYVHVKYIYIYIRTYVLKSKVLLLDYLNIQNSLFCGRLLFALKKMICFNKKTPRETLESDLQKPPPKRWVFHLPSVQ